MEPKEMKMQDLGEVEFPRIKFPPICWDPVPWPWWFIKHLKAKQVIDLMKVQVKYQADRLKLEQQVLKRQAQFMEEISKLMDGFRV